MSETASVVVNETTTEAGAIGYWTPWLLSIDGGAAVMVQGTYTAAIKLQRRPERDADGSAWPDSDAGAVDAASYPEATDDTADTNLITQRMWGPWLYRLGCDSGDFTDGEAKCWLGVRNARQMPGEPL